MSNIPFSTIDEGVDYFTEKMQEIYPSDIPAGEPEETVDRFIHALQNRALRSNSIQDFYEYGINAVVRLQRVIPSKIEKDMHPRQLTPEEEAELFGKNVDAKYPDQDEDITAEDLQHVVRRW
jgi:hypothetical protein